MTTVLSQMGERITGEIAAAFPDLDLRSIGTGEALEDDAAGEVLLTSHWFAQDFPTLFARGVRWVHNFGTGVDHFPFDQDALGAGLADALDDPAREGQAGRHGVRIADRRNLDR